MLMLVTQISISCFYFSSGSDTTTVLSRRPDDLPGTGPESSVSRHFPLVQKLLIFLEKLCYIYAASFYSYHKFLCARLCIERSGFEPWPGTLCCVHVLGQDT